MQKIPVRLLDFAIKRWTVTASFFFQRILENYAYAVLMEKRDVCLSGTIHNPMCVQG